MAVTVEELYQQPTKSALVDYLLRQFDGANYPITDWHVGSVQRTLLEQAEAAAAYDLISKALVQVARMSWPDSAVGDWLTDLAHYVYAIDRTPGTFAVQAVTLNCDASHGPYTIVSDEELTATDGKAYTANTGGTLATSGSLSIQATARNVGPALGLINALSRKREGVTISSSIATISLVKRFGSNDEADSSLLGRLLAFWPDLSAYDAQPRYVRWALASTTEITRAKLAPNPAFANEIIVTVASVAGAVSGGGVSTAQAYINARRPITQLGTVQSATTVAITAGGSVWCKPGTIPAVQAAAQTAWGTYLGAVTIGQRISLARFIQIIRNAGALDIQAPGLIAGVGVPAPFDVVLGSTEVPILPTVDPTLADQLDWFEV